MIMKIKNIAANKMIRVIKKISPIVKRFNTYKMNVVALREKNNK